MSRMFGDTAASCTVSPPEAATCPSAEPSAVLPRRREMGKYRREPSVTGGPFCVPSLVICLVAVTRGGEGGTAHQLTPATVTRMTATRPARSILRVRLRAGVIAGTAVEWPDAADARPELVSRFSRFRSASTSRADWYRTSRSFSSALTTMRSRSGGMAGLWRAGHGVAIQDRIEQDGRGRALER